MFAHLSIDVIIIGSLCPVLFVILKRCSCQLEKFHYIAIYSLEFLVHQTCLVFAAPSRAELMLKTRFERIGKARWLKIVAQSVSCLVGFRLGIFERYYVFWHEGLPLIISNYILLCYEFINSVLQVLTTPQAMLSFFFLSKAGFVVSGDHPSGSCVATEKDSVAVPKIVGEPPRINLA